MDAGLRVRTLWRAAEVLGGKAQLRAELRVPMHELEAWLSGVATPPVRIFLRAVDLLTRAEPATLNETIRASRLLRDQARDIRSRSVHAMERARQLYEDSLASPGLRRPAGPMTALQFLAATFTPAESASMLQHALEAAVTSTGSDAGTIQLACPEGLRIVAHKNCTPEFLGHFALVTDAGCACGAAMQQRQRVVVADVATHPAFAAADTREVMRQAGLVAVQSTPLLGAGGELLGVLSTHFDRRHEPSPRELELIDTLSERVAQWLDAAMLAAPARE